jgi:flagellar basal body P-ring formation protein FlgA
MNTAKHNSHRQPCASFPYQALFWIMLLTLAVLPLSSLASSGKHSNDTLRNTAKNFLEQQTALMSGQESEVSVAHLDKRLQLARCEEPVTAFLAPGSKLQGRLNVGLRCSSQNPWTVYIPAYIKSFANIVVAARPLSRGTHLSSGDVMMIRQNLSELRSDYFTQPEHLTGKILVKNLPQGAVFSTRIVKAPLLVQRGDEVTILASVAGLTVRGKGKALSNAALGERVSVRNKKSKRVIQGIAIRYGTVSVQM